MYCSIGYLQWITSVYHTHSENGNYLEIYSQMKLANMAHLYTFLSTLNLRNEDRIKNVVAKETPTKTKLQDNLGTKRCKCSGHTKGMKSHGVTHVSMKGR